MPLTPMAPTFTSKLAWPLRKAGLVKQTMGGGYKIIDKGLAALDAAKG